MSTPDDFKKWVHTFLTELGIDQCADYQCRVGMRLSRLADAAGYSREEVKNARAVANAAIGVETYTDEKTNAGG